MKPLWNLKHLFITTAISLMVSYGSAHSLPRIEGSAKSGGSIANMNNQTTPSSSIKTAGYIFSYTINMNDIKNAATILFPRGESLVKPSGSIKIPQVPKDLMPIYLIDKSGHIIAIDVLSKDKITLSFNAENSAKAYLATSGLMFSWYGEQQNKAYQEVAKHPDFPALVKKIRRSGKIPDSKDFIDLVRKIQVDTSKKIQTGI